jgi:rhodanese-related sulfurtransferase
MVCAIVGPGVRIVSAQDTPHEEKSPRPKTVEWSGGSYCGVYSLYAALRALGAETRFLDLVDRKYIASDHGSSLAQLQQAAEDFGLRASPMSGLTATSLRSAEGPVILHMRRPGRGTPFSHWVLFLGVEDGKARVVDPPNGVKLLDFATLLSLWDGVGLLLARQPPDTQIVRWASWIEQIVALVLVAALAASTHIFLTRALWRFGSAAIGWSMVRSFAGALGLLGIAGGVAVCWHLLSDEGFFNNPRAVGQVIVRHFEPPLATVELTEVTSSLDRADVRLVDARLPEDFDAGHIPSAVNLPVLAGIFEREEILARFGPGERIIVYCQNETCPWSHSVASDMVFLGFRNVAVFPGGWQKWQEYERSKRKR